MFTHFQYSLYLLKLVTMLFVAGCAGNYTTAGQAAAYRQAFAVCMDSVGYIPAPALSGASQACSNRARRYADRRRSPRP